MTRALIAVAGAAAIAACLLARGPDAAHADVPATPPGWSLAFGDGFDGPAGSLPSSERWRLTTGTSYPGGPANWGTGRGHGLHRRPGQRQPRPGREPADHAAARRRGHWTSARVETNAQELKPPPGGTMRIESRLQIPNVTPATGGLGETTVCPGVPCPGNFHRFTFE